MVGLHIWYKLVSDLKRKNEFNVTDRCRREDFECGEMTTHFDHDIIAVFLVGRIET